MGIRTEGRCRARAAVPRGALARGRRGNAPFRAADTARRESDSDVPGPIGLAATCGGEAGRLAAPRLV